jgi:hypothetical protein
MGWRAATTGFAMFFTSKCALSQGRRLDCYSCDSIGITELQQKKLNNILGYICYPLHPKITLGG